MKGNIRYGNSRFRPPPALFSTVTFMAIAREHSLELDAESDLGAPRATMDVVVDTERLVKSAERVRNLGEVFTPSGTVEAMLALLPGDFWDVHPAKTFLEPSCGDGNFLVAILARKLNAVTMAHRQGTLPAGRNTEAVQFHALEALASIYAVDISADNVVGGTPGHEKGARTRLLELFDDWNRAMVGKRLPPTSRVRRSAEWIVLHNVLVGNMLPEDALGNPTNRGSLPFIEYQFRPSSQTVSLSVVLFDDILAIRQQEAAGEMRLFGLPEPETFWDGRASSIAEAAEVEPPDLTGPARNGARRV
jgi:hypothetical protein